MVRRPQKQLPRLRKSLSKKALTLGLFPGLAPPTRQALPSQPEGAFVLLPPLLPRSRRTRALAAPASVASTPPALGRSKRVDSLRHLERRRLLAKTGSNCSRLAEKRNEWLSVGALISETTATGGRGGGIEKNKNHPPPTTPTPSHSFAFIAARRRRRRRRSRLQAPFEQPRVPIWTRGPPRCVADFLRALRLPSTLRQHSLSAWLEDSKFAYLSTHTV